MFFAALKPDGEDQHGGDFLVDDRLKNLKPFNFMSYFELCAASIIPAFFTNLVDNPENFINEFLLFFAVSLSTIDLGYRKYKGYYLAVNYLFSPRSGGHVFFIPNWVFGWIVLGISLVFTYLA